MIRLFSIVIVLFALTATANAQCKNGQCEFRQPVRNTVKAVVHAQPVRRLVKPLRGIRERAKARREARRERRRNRRGR
jgi:hypothetical protein